MPEAEPPFVVRSSGTSGRRRLHYDPDCLHLQQGTSTREASPAEIPALEDCKRCSGGPIDHPSSYDVSYQRALQDAARDRAVMPTRSGVLVLLAGVLALAILYALGVLP